MNGQLQVLVRGELDRARTLLLLVSLRVVLQSVVVVLTQMD